MADIDPWTVQRRYVLLNRETDELLQDANLTREEAGHINEKYAAEDSPLRWRPFAEREGDAVAA